MRLGTRVYLQVAVSVAIAFVVYTLTMGLLVRKTFARVLDDAGQTVSPVAVALLSRLETAMALYSLLNTTIVVAFIAWIIERTFVRPMAQLEDDLERFNIDEFEASLSGRNEMQRLTQGIGRMSRLARARGETLQEQREQLVKTGEQLTRAEQLALVGQLGAGLAHELGNPLGAVMGYTALIRDEADAKARAELLGRVDAELERMNGLLRELLDYARPAALKDEVVVLAEVLRAAASLLSHQPRGRGVALDLGIGAEVRVLGDAARLTQVFLNLFLNAADAAQAGGDGARPAAITVRALRSDDAWQILVADNGPGFSADALAHAAEPFFTTKGPGKGTGLGLAVCTTLVEEQGGALRFANASEGGAVVTVTLRKAAG